MVPKQSDACGTLLTLSRPAGSPIRGPGRRWPVPRFRDCVSTLPGGFKPGLLRNEHLAESFLGCLSERGAEREVGDVGHVAAILLTPEHVDVVVGHVHSLGFKWYFSTSMRNCL